MSATNFTPIIIYNSGTTTNTPTSGNLASGELAINYADGKLFYKDSSGVVQVLATKGGVGSSTNTQVLYNSSGLVTGSNNLYYNGTSLFVTNSGVATIQVTGGATNSGYSWSDGTRTGVLYASGLGGTSLFSTSNHPIYFGTNNTTVGQFNTSGQLLLGTTASNGASLVISTNTGTTNWNVGPYNSVATNFYVTGNNLTNGVVLSGVTATSWSALSDARLKNVKSTYTNALADIAQIQPVKFTWKSDATNKPCVGVLAQSVKEVVPESIEMNAMPNSEDKTEYLSIRYTELIPLLIASIQEQQALIESLTTRLTALESK
jgi:hypothetical protein